jgi:flagellar M-ring protein FliF
MAVENATMPASVIPTVPDLARSPQRKTLLTLMSEWPLSRKIATAAVLVIALALIIVLLLQARTANHQLLYANLSMSDAGAVVTWLKNQKVAYSLRNDGKDIWVPADQLYQTRLDLASNGLPTGGGVGFEVFDKQSFALSDYVQKVNYTRALQGELARTITSLAPVESTRVHLALPEKRLLKSQQKDASASVIVNLHPGQTLDKKQVQGIIHLVAGSVADLEAANVKVIDASGVVLEGLRQEDSNTLVSLDTLNYQRQVENNLEMRAQDLLDKTIGKDHAMVRVSADLNFSKVEKTQEYSTPMTRWCAANKSTRNQTAPIPLEASPGCNRTCRVRKPVQPQPLRFQQELTYHQLRNQQDGQPHRQSHRNHQQTLRLRSCRRQGEKRGRKHHATPRTAEEMKTIENMVASAIGLMPTRGDVITVTSMPFLDTREATAGAEATPEAFIYQYLPLAKYGLIALGIVLLYFLLIRPVVKTMKGEVKEHYKTVEQLEQEQREQQRQLAMQEPEEPILPVDDAITALRREVLTNQVPTAFIIKNWIQEG